MAVVVGVQTMYLESDLHLQSLKDINMIFSLRSKLFSKIWQLTNVPCGCLELAKKVCNGTGSNKGIGLETVRQLTSNLITVALLLDLRRGPESRFTLGVFHMTDPARFAECIKIQFGKT